MMTTNSKPKRKIKNENDFHFSVDPKSNPKYVVIVMRDNARLYLPKDNLENSWANMKNQLNKYIRSNDGWLKEQLGFQQPPPQPKEESTK